MTSESPFIQKIEVDRLPIELFFGDSTQKKIDDWLQSEKGLWVKEHMVSSMQMRGIQWVEHPHDRMVVIYAILTGKDITYFRLKYGTNDSMS